MVISRRLRPAAFAIALAASLAACVVTPQTSQVYDQDCQIYVKHMTLQAEQIPFFAGCSNDGCLVMLAAAGVVTATSVVISGSIVVVGNIVYWAEKQDRCVRPLPSVPAARLQ